MTRTELLKCLVDRPCSACKFKKPEGCSKWLCVFETETEDEPKKGEWIVHAEDVYTPDRQTPVMRIINECPFCHKKLWIDGKMNFCPSCGADMRGKADDNS